MAAQFLFIPSDVNRSEGGVTCKVPSEHTDNRYTVLEAVFPPGGGAPFHVHQREDEMIYVVEGEFEVQHSNQTYRALAGAMIVLPKGQPHAFRNSGDTPNRVLITAIPGGLDRYFEEIGALVAAGEATDERINAINQRYEIDFAPVRDA